MPLYDKNLFVYVFLEVPNSVFFCDELPGSKGDSARRHEYYEKCYFLYFSCNKNRRAQVLYCQAPTSDFLGARRHIFF